MTSPQTAAVRAAAQAQRDAQALHHKISERLAAAREPGPALPDLDGLQRALEDASADQAIGMTDAATVATARGALADARAAVAATAGERATQLATAEGLQRRLESAEGQSAAAAEALNNAAVEYLRAELQGAEAAYLGAAQAVVLALHRHAAAASALRIRGAPVHYAAAQVSQCNLPVIGSASEEAFADHQPKEVYFGSGLMRVLPAHASTIEADLAALIEAPAVGIVAAIKRLRAA